MTAEYAAHVNPVRCTFHSTGLTTIRRVVLAAIDQICATTDVDLDLLESLEIPVGEVLTALHPFGIDTVEVAVGDMELHVSIVVHDRPSSVAIDLFGEAARLIDAFFTIRIEPGDRRIDLIGSLR